MQFPVAWGPDKVIQGRLASPFPLIQTFLQGGMYVFSLMDQFAAGQSILFAVFC